MLSSIERIELVKLEFVLGFELDVNEDFSRFVNNLNLLNKESSIEFGVEEVKDGDDDDDVDNGSGRGFELNEILLSEVFEDFLSI